MSRIIVDHDLTGRCRVALAERRQRVAAALSHWRAIADIGSDSLVEEIWVSGDERTVVGTIRRDADRPDRHVLEDGTILIGGQGAQFADCFATPEQIGEALKSENARALGPLDGGWSIVSIEASGEVRAARDRFGLKPLYAAQSDDGCLVLASNSGAIVKGGWIKAEANPDFLARYAGYQYRGTYGDRPTAFKKIDLLDLTYVHSWGREGYSRQRYWDFDPAAPYDHGDDADFEARYRETLIEMARRFIDPRSGERLAIALSGGIDSGSVVGLMHHVTGEPVEAVSMTYHEATVFDESELIASSVRDHVGTWHDVKIDDKVLLDDLPVLYDRFDVPLATISIYGYDYLYREAARRGMSTIFTGSGGDYIQAGNYTCFLYHLADLKTQDPELYEKELSWWIHWHGTEQFPKTAETAENFFRESVNLAVEGELLPFKRPLAEGVLNPDFASAAASLEGRSVGNYGAYSRSYAMQEYLFEAVAPGTETEDLIDWTWGTSMTSPFFSHDVAEFGWRLPLNQRVRDGVNKPLARRALRGICADEILDRVDKSGFNAPFDLWVRGPINEFAMDLFRSQSFRQRGVYDARRFDEVLDAHMRGDANHMMLLWQALNMELWMRSWIDG